LKTNWATSVINSHPDGIVVTDEKYKLVFANQRYFDIWGFTPQRARNMRPDERYMHQLNMLRDHVQNSV
jgi:PAS domain S-box-containing protein